MPLSLRLADQSRAQAENLIKWIVLPVACLAHMGIAALLAKVCCACPLLTPAEPLTLGAQIGARIARLSAAESKMTLLACGFHNLGILPFVFVAALSRYTLPVADVHCTLHTSHCVTAPV